MGFKLRSYLLGTDKPGRLDKNIKRVMIMVEIRSGPRTESLKKLLFGEEGEHLISRSVQKVGRASF